MVSVTLEEVALLVSIFIATIGLVSLYYARRSVRLAEAASEVPPIWPLLDKSPYPDGRGITASFVHRTLLATSVGFSVFLLGVWTLILSVALGAFYSEPTWLPASASVLEVCGLVLFVIGARRSERMPHIIRTLAKWMGRGEFR